MGEIQYFTSLNINSLYLYDGVIEQSEKVDSGISSKTKYEMAKERIV